MGGKSSSEMRTGVVCFTQSTVSVRRCRRVRQMCSGWFQWEPFLKMNLLKTVDLGHEFVGKGFTKISGGPDKN
jgi:hypothetical protein